MDISEKGFEDQIEAYLRDVHGYRSHDGRKTAGRYDVANCLDVDLLLEFLTATQPAAWQQLLDQHGTALRQKFLDRLTKQRKRHGTLHLLRNGIKDYGVYFDLAYFRPATTLNPEHQANYGKNIFSVMRQVQYSAKNNNSIDMVLFLNGLPIATLELKNKLTGQNAINAIVQYQKDRDPRGEPLLAFKRCLVHFAVDGDEVYMTTHLRGAATYFLPFNQGRDGAAGNPINPHGYASSYLWAEIFAPDNLLELLAHFIHLETDLDSQREKLIFPRYHQRDAVRQLIAHARTHGPGHNYLIQHSAGSGKSNSIAWLAHRLSSLHDDANRRVFDSVIVITDRRILDRQLRDTILQFERQTGIVQAIDQHSSQLAEALESGSPIIVTTLQKFPFVVDKVGQLAGRRFAIIADEAHSSQTGETSKSLKQVLGDNHLPGSSEASGKVVEDGEDLINTSMAARGQQPNLSFFAFTATPKQKTLELFGVKRSDGSYHPSHLYSMRQAIEEGFILDVLANYTTHQTFFNLLKTIEDDPRYPKSKAIGQMKRFVGLHEFTIARKTAIMVDHFWHTTRHRIPTPKGVGQAKAMVVTSSRLHAIRYKLAFDKYIKQQGYPLKALVAFSGEVEDGGKKYTEAGMNGFPDTQTAGAFDKPDCHFLIVAEKFQTGFDQPLLHTMYVDKVLSGVNAVQTLSRLNRTHPAKTETMVLDFVNEAEHIRQSFQPYYEATLLSEGSDPNKLYDIYDELGDFNLYTDDEVRQVAELFLTQGEKAAKLQPLLKTVVTRFTYLPGAEQKDHFRSLLQGYIRLYAFLSQVMPFQDADLERLYLFARLLNRMLPRGRNQLPLSVQENIDLESYRIQQTHSGPLALEQQNGGVLDPLSEHPVGGEDEEIKEPLSQILAELNERFGTEFDDGDKVFFAELSTRLANHESIQHSARVNSKEHVRLLFESLFPGVLQTMIESNFDLYKRITDSAEFRQTVIAMLFEEVYPHLPGSYQLLGRSVLAAAGRGDETGEEGEGGG